MPAEQLIMRGQTASGLTEVLNFGGSTPGYAYQLTEFQLYPSTAIGAGDTEAVGSVTADDTAEDPENPNFNHAGLIATAHIKYPSSSSRGPQVESVINDLFYITQDLILMVEETGSTAVNWQCKFKKVKLSLSAEAVANFNQFTIYDG